MNEPSESAPAARPIPRKKRTPLPDTDLVLPTDRKEVRPDSSQTAEGVGPPVWNGRLVLLYAFDLANEIEVEKITEIAGRPAKPYRFDGSRRSPHYLLFYSLPYAQLDSITVRFGAEEHSLNVSTKVLAIGAISLRFELGFENLSLNALKELVDQVAAETRLSRYALELAKKIQESLAPYCIGPTRSIQPDEPYLVICLYGPQDGQPFFANRWLKTHARQVAALLADEEPELLSDLEVQERLSRTLQFYRDDLAVIDWERSFLIDLADGIEEILYVLELANVQWVELETYDRLLDNALEHAYALISQNRPAGASTRLLTRLRETRIDLAKLRDELTNITRILGDWYLGRVYSAAASRMQFSLWQTTIQEKLKTVNDLYEMIRHERAERWMLILESSIVALFILDLLAYLFFK